MGVDEARNRIALARRQFERVEGAGFEPDPESAVIWAFYAYENCVTALAVWYGRRWTRNHREKAELARRLHADGLISRDVGDDLEELMFAASHVARAALLKHGVFPLSRPELPSQLEAVEPGLARLLDRLIGDDVDVACLRSGESLLKRQIEQLQ